MAKIEEDREDLFAEATAYATRGEVLLAGQKEPIFIGCRADGRFSFYFGADPVYQFDTQGRLRRAYIAGKMYRTQGNALACLTRVRSESETVLERQDLLDESLEPLQKQMLSELKTLWEGLKTGTVKILRSTLASEDFSEKVTELCQRVFEQPVFLAPRIPGKR